MLKYNFLLLLGISFSAIAFAQVVDPSSRAGFLTNQPRYTNTDPFPPTPAPPLRTILGRQRTPAEYDPQPAPTEIPNPLGVESLNGFLELIVSALTKLAVPVVIIMVLYGALLITISGGNPEKLARGGRTIMWAAAGFCILLLANGIVAIINSLFSS